MIHIGIEPVLASWADNKGQPFINLVRDIDSKLRAAIISLDWSNF